MTALRVGILLLVTTLVPGCVAKGSKYADVSANGGKCRFDLSSHDLPEDQRSYSRIAESDLGSCVRVRSFEPNVARTLREGQMHLFATQCAVTIRREPPQPAIPGAPRTSCVKRSPITDGDQMMIFASDKERLTLVYRFIGWPFREVVADLKPVDKEMDSKDETVAYLADIPAGRNDPGYFFYVYLNNLPAKQSSENFRYYYVEAFAKDEEKACHDEAPGKDMSQKVDCDAFVPDRQTGTGQGGDPPKDP